MTDQNDIKFGVGGEVLGAANRPFHLCGAMLRSRADGIERRYAPRALDQTVPLQDLQKAALPRRDFQHTVAVSQRFRQCTAHPHKVTLHPVVAQDVAVDGRCHRIARRQFIK